MYLKKQFDKEKIKEIADDFNFMTKSVEMPPPKSS